MLEVTKSDITALDDSQLRALIGRLCEAEVEREGLGISGIRYGGNQNAPDGGIDVAVELGQILRKGSYIPTAFCCIQVKKYKFPPANIKKELCSQGKLRPLFKDLALRNGSYILVSGADDLSESALSNRLNAMKACLGDLSSKITLRFYDQTALCQWSNTHPSVAAWIKQTLGNKKIGCG